MPGTDWRLLKAQGYQESLLNPFAVSPAGAKGLMQFMPGTWNEVSGELESVRLNAIMVPEVSIIAGAYYMRKLNKYWSSPRPEMDRYMLALASYNAGAGNLTKAQRACGGKLLYAEIISCLPQITGSYSTETITYVERIVGRWWPRMLFG